jgi:flagellar biogenesis protein FliO
MEFLKKENILIIVGLTCFAIYAYRQLIKENKSTPQVTNILSIIGGLAFGLNTLITIVK